MPNLPLEECHKYLPYLNNPPYSGQIQWACGDVGLSPPPPRAPDETPQQVHQGQAAPF